MSGPEWRRKLGRWSVGLVTLGLVGGGVLAWGGLFLVDVDPLPEGAQVIVVLRGGAESSKVRLAGATRLLQSGVADNVLLSIRSGSHWGSPIPEMARGYVEREYGPDAHERYALCANAADSTGEEALALHQCLTERGWQRVVVVPSDYHTRRAKLMWAAVAERTDTPLQVFVRGVADSDLDPRGWWRKRRCAKTWLVE